MCSTFLRLFPKENHRSRNRKNKTNKNIHRTLFYSGIITLQTNKSRRLFPPFFHPGQYRHILFWPRIETVIKAEILRSNEKVIYTKSSKKSVDLEILSREKCTRFKIIN